MDPKTLVLKYLDEAHATEAALVTNLRAHIAMAPEGSYRRLLEDHLEETRRHQQAISRRRDEIGADGGRGVVAGMFGLARDAVGQAVVLTKGPLDAVRTMSSAERALKNAKDECATEALEIATYDALEAAAKAAGDEATAALAAAHRADEERMLDNLRKEIPRLAERTVEDLTDVKVAAAAGASRRSTASRSSTTTRRKTGTTARSGTASRTRATTS